MKRGKVYRMGFNGQPWNNWTLNSAEIFQSHAEIPFCFVIQGQIICAHTYRVRVSSQPKRLSHWSDARRKPTFHSITTVPKGSLFLSFSVETRGLFFYRDMKTLNGPSVSLCITLPRYAKCFKSYQFCADLIFPCLLECKSLMQFRPIF